LDGKSRQSEWQQVLERTLFFVSVSGMDIISIIALQWFLGKGKRELCVEWKD
jgi:hypothetical protein